MCLHLSTHRTAPSSLSLPGTIRTSLHPRKPHPCVGVWIYFQAYAAACVIEMGDGDRGARCCAVCAFQVLSGVWVDDSPVARGLVERGRKPQEHQHHAAASLATASAAAAPSDDASGPTDGPGVSAVVEGGGGGGEDAVPLQPFKRARSEPEDESEGTGEAAAGAMEDGPDGMSHLHSPRWPPPCLSCASVHAAVLLLFCVPVTLASLATAPQVATGPHPCLL